MHREEDCVEIYAVANQKGGVGKTTVTLGLAGELARRHVRTLLVDLDPQASATKVLGIDVDKGPTVADALLEPERFVLAQCVVETECVVVRANKLVGVE
jgi:chromosome partitioning protein